MTPCARQKSQYCLSAAMKWKSSVKKKRKRFNVHIHALKWCSAGSTCATIDVVSLTITIIVMQKSNMPSQTVSIFLLKRRDAQSPSTGPAISSCKTWNALLVATKPGENYSVNLTPQSIAHRCVRRTEHVDIHASLSAQTHAREADVKVVRK